MSGTALTSRGIADADDRNLLVGVVARRVLGRVDLNVRAGSQPLGRAEALHHLDRHARAILAVWPDADRQVADVLTFAIDDARGIE